MKQISKAFFIIGIAVLSSLTISAQRYAYVDTDYILKNLDSYQDAQTELDRISSQWQKEIEQRYEAIDRLYKAYQAEKVLLTEDMRKEREDEIIRQEEEAKSLQRQRFGVDGDLFRRREELIQPIQEEVFQAIKQVADGGGFSVMFDKAGQSNILYADPRYDKSDRVLSRLGVSASDRDDDDSDQDSGTDSPRQTESKGGQSPRR
ncbi:MAG TPA: OmpH family outer membrane protein [Cryomorphaceae bacterium]|nr:OmpH family outer membrane protein [Cryomorphaceae bacterium]